MDDWGGGGGGTDGSLNLPGGAGLKLGAPGLTGGPNDENGEDACGGAGGVGRKGGGGSDPGMEAKGVTVCGAGAAANGEETGLAGKVGRPGFSVPIYRTTIKITWNSIQFNQKLSNREATKCIQIRVEIQIKNNE